MVATDPLWLPSLSYDETELRKMDSALVMADGTALGSRPGIRPGDPGLAVSLAGTTVNVTAGAAVLYRSGQGVYRAQLAATSPGTLTAANATFARIDLVYLRVWDTAIDSSGLRKADTVLLTGTPSGSPAIPTPGATEIYIPLATINVPNTGGGGTGAATVSSAIRQVTVAPGGVLPVLSTAAPSTAGPGTILYYTDTGAYWYFQADGTTKALLVDSPGGTTLGKTIEALKTGATQTVTSSTTLVNATQLVLPLAANATYALSGLVIYDGAFGSGDIKVDWSLPASATMLWTANGMGTAANGLYTANTVPAGTTIALGTYGAGPPYTSLSIEGTIVTAGTAGNAQFRFAQNSSNAVPTSVYAKSRLSARRIA
ncbi:hypothetical protein ACIGFK_13370 [Streptomyces sp. NPDC085524]|uniref:hypothetical protein n=1 Tax=Streptomyces sp. NPDC085524 TaxID=3365728 RepID=UPI0037D0C7FD